MDACTPVSSISEDFASCVRNAYFCCKLTYLGTKQCSRCDSAQESVKVVPVEDLNDFQGCSSNEETLKVEKLETLFSGLHTEDFFDQSPCHKPSLQLHVCDLKDGADCPKDEKQNVFQQDALDGSVKKSFSKCTTFPRSNKQPSLITSDEGEILPSASLDTQCSLKSGNLVYTRCTSLPHDAAEFVIKFGARSVFYLNSEAVGTTSKLVSALKGGREKEGAPPKTELRVKWAPDVYDPPATSMSHTVKNNHYQRPKAKKKDQHKHKHKSKSSRVNTREKKHANHSSISSNAHPQYSRMQVPESSSVSGVSAQSSVRVLNYVASSQESKCGSSLLVGSHSKLHFSVAEAT